ncbi:MAG: GTP-binding protein [Myxococcota bacterium]
MRVPTTIVSGALGVGKTTAILSALRARPEGERWAVLVNEFGTVGIDGAILGEHGGLAVREIAGGCICCTANLPLRVGLVKLLREVRPDRLLIEPTGLAHPASIVDVVRSPGLRESVDLRATITLVDPRKLAPGDPLWTDQVRAADVLVGSWADVATPEQLAGFRAFAQGLYPPPVVIATTTRGQLDPAWLELDPTPRGVLTTPGALDAGELGFVWPPDRVFRFDALQELVQTLVRPNPLLPEGVLRLKGVVRTPRGWLLLHADPETVRFEPIGWRRDSRIALIVRGAAPAADPLLSAFDEVIVDP